ncbi:hypothetical protein MVES_003079 [Malassezia vespertilionis]|uniref:Uncharacterized protein n=1 Tax=Malassezia vespertilionis TaxID=2020962 RepID=A0A2N1J9Q0_9BASI|nr:hypothetical protein MVES_003079 [Malassezia vespertilionis]
MTLDITWRTAFSITFGLEEREDKIAASIHQGVPGATSLRIAPALRRLDPASWRAEFASRVAILRRWRKSRTSVILTDPRIATLDALALSASHRFVLSLSYECSLASRSNAFTGKVAKEFLHARGFATTAPNGQPNMDHSPPCTALAADPLASYVVWGQRCGDVGLTAIDWRGQNARGTFQHRTFPRQEAHRAPVSAIAFPIGGESVRQQSGDAALTFATASADGTVVLWHPKHDAALWRGAVPSSDEPLGTMDRLAYRSADGILAAGTRSGAVLVWAHIPTKALAAHAIHGRPPVESHVQCITIAPAPFASTQAADAPRISSLVLDTYDATKEHISLLVHYTHARFFLRHTLTPASRAVHTTVFGAPSISQITSVHCNFDARASPPLASQRRSTRFQERSFVCAGTASGGIGVWEWDAQAPLDDAWLLEEHSVHCDAQALPALVLDGHHNAITALYSTPALLFAGTEDGTIKAFDTLTGTLVRVFNERTARRQPARLLANGSLGAEHAARFRVNQIVAHDELFVAAIGPQVLAWRTQHAADADVPAKRATAAPRHGRPTQRLQMRKALDRAAQEEQEILEAEEKERGAIAAQQRMAHSKLQGRLDEDTALDYALMLSREEAEQTALTDEFASDLMYGEPDMHDGMADAVLLRSPTLSALAASPNTSTRAWDMLQQAGKAASTTDGEGASKLRTVSIPRSARLTPSTASQGSVGSCNSMSPMASPADWPGMAQQSSKTPSLGAWARSSPALRSVDARQGTALARHDGAGLSSQTAAALASQPPSWSLEDEEEDDELRLALALSLAEHESNTL